MDIPVAIAHAGSTVAKHEMAILLEEISDRLPPSPSTKDKDILLTGEHPDADVLEWLKSKGAGYQTRINSVLRASPRPLAGERPGSAEPGTRRLKRVAAKLPFNDAVDSSRCILDGHPSRVTVTRVAR